MAYCTISDLRKVLPKTITLGDDTITTPNVIQIKGKVDTLSTATAMYFIDLATQHINGRLETLYFCPLRRIKQIEVLLTQNIAAGGDIVYVPDAMAFNVGNLIRISDGTHTETHFVAEMWTNDVARFGQLKLDSVLQFSYTVTAATRVSELIFPNPIPVCCARIACGAIIDKLFITEQSPDAPTAYGKSLRTQATNDLDAILAGAMHLKGQDYNGKRFVRTPMFDTIKSATQLPPGQSKEI